MKIIELLPTNCSGRLLTAIDCVDIYIYIYIYIFLLACVLLLFPILKTYLEEVRGLCFSLSLNFKSQRSPHRWLMLLEIMYFIVSFMNKIFLQLFFFFFLDPSHLIYFFVWVLIEVAFCITFCCSGSFSNYITLKTNCWLCTLQHRKPADGMLMGCSSRCPVGAGPASPRYSDRLSPAVNNYLSEASRQEVRVS